MRTAIIVAALTVGTAGGGAKMTSEEALRLLERVGARYGAMNDYELEVRIVSTTGFPGMEGRTRYRMAAAAPGRFSLSRQDDREGLTELVVSDGRTVWSFDGRAKQYRVEPLRDETGRMMESRGVVRFAERHIRYKERFALVGGREQRAPKFERYEDVESGGVRQRCAVIRTESRESAGKRAWAETLWIDTGRALVMRSRRRFLPEAGALPPVSNLPEVASTQLPSEEDARFEWRRIEGPLEDELFRFEAPAGSRRVER